MVDLIRCHLMGKYEKKGILAVLMEDPLIQRLKLDCIKFAPTSWVSTNP